MKPLREHQQHQTSALTMADQKPSLETEADDEGSVPGLVQRLGCDCIPNADAKIAKYNLRVQPVLLGNEWHQWLIPLDPSKPVESGLDVPVTIRMNFCPFCGRNVDVLASAGEKTLTKKENV